MEEVEKKKGVLVMREPVRITSCRIGLYGIGFWTRNFLVLISIATPTTAIAAVIARLEVGI